MKLGLGQENPIYWQMFTSTFMPEATAEGMDSFNGLQLVSASPENAFRASVVTAGIDVRDLVPLVTVLTLVLHSREELQAPFEWGRHVAALIPGARLVPLSSKNHILQENEPAWPVFISEVRKFLGVGESYAQPAVAAAPPQPYSVLMSTETGEEAEALSLISGMDDVSLARFSVVLGYAKFDEATRNVSKDAR